MGHKRTDTLGDLAKLGALVMFRCRGCGHVGRFRAADLAAFYGFARRPERIRARCTGCDGTDIDVEPDWGEILNRPKRPRPTPI